MEISDQGLSFLSEAIKGLISLKAIFLNFSLYLTFEKSAY